MALTPCCQIWTRREPWALLSGSGAQLGGYGSGPLGPNSSTQGQEGAMPGLQDPILVHVGREEVVPGSCAAYRWALYHLSGPQG